MLISNSNKSEDDITEDDWTIGLIMQIIWNKYPYQVGAFAVLFFAFAFVLVWWCGRNVSAAIFANLALAQNISAERFVLGGSYFRVSFQFIYKCELF